jgi:hypothetical protein
VVRFYTAVYRALKNKVKAWNNGPVSPIGRNSGVLIGGEPHQNSVSRVSSNSGGFCAAKTDFDGLKWFWSVFARISLRRLESLPMGETGLLDGLWC